jgi:hypothetical protein
MTGYNSAQSTYRALLGEALDALEELVVLMHATYKGEYTPDVFTVQHANTVLVKHGRTNIYDEGEVFRGWIDCPKCHKQHHISTQCEEIICN